MALPGEILMKQFVQDMAASHQVGESAIWNRIWRGKLKPVVRRVNSRVIFVQTANVQSS